MSPSSPVAFSVRPISSNPAPVSVASPSFPRVKLDSMLWHRWFGHIGMDTTYSALMKDYVMGIQLDGSFIRNHCISCIVGKSPQKSYPYHGNHAAAIGELLHMDLCGPYPVQAPRGKTYFFNILDDRLNWGFTFGLQLKSDTFSHYMATKAFLECSKDFVIKNVHCGGELELTAGKMGVHFVLKGITIQRTVPYAHQQNGKSEHYIRTIEEGGQALLADAGLPMSFWLDAMLTHQYLVNRLPTSTLPTNVTPYELITSGCKPDLSHLRVWGCDCYVAVPDELRPKAGFKHFRAIFMGYEDTGLVGMFVIFMGSIFSRMMLFLMNIHLVVWVSIALYPLLPPLLRSHLVPFVTNPMFGQLGARPMMMFSISRSFVGLNVISNDLF